MDNADDYLLFGGQISGATTRTTGAKTPITGLNGMTAVTLDFDFAYGSGGNTCSAIVQAVPSTGGKPCDIARVDFLKASRRAQLNLEGMLSKGVTNYADLAAEGVNDGILFSGLQVVVVTDTTGGDYSNTTLTVTAGVR